MHLFASSSNGLTPVKGALFNFCMDRNARNLMRSSTGLFFCLICVWLTKVGLIDISLREDQCLEVTVNLILRVFPAYVVDEFAGKTIHSEVGSLFALTL